MLLCQQDADYSRAEECAVPEIESQSPEQSLANVQKFKCDFGLTGSKKAGKEKLKEILSRAGSFSDEVIATRKGE